MKAFFYKLFPLYSSVLSHFKIGGQCFESLTKTPKYLKMLLLTAVLLVGSASAWAEIVTYTFSEHFTDATAIGNGNIDDNISFTSAKNSSSTTPMYYTSGTAVRIYGHNNAAKDGGEIVLIANNSAIIKNVVVNITQTAATTYYINGSSTGTALTYSSNTGTISSINATSVKIKNTIQATTQLRISSLVITYELPSCDNPPAPPTAGTHIPTSSQITWKWSPVSETPNTATSYLYNTTNDLVTATEITATQYVETGLAGNSDETFYVWAKNSCGISEDPVTLTETTLCKTATIANFATPTVSRTFSSTKYTQITTITTGTGNIVYSSDNTDVATVDANTSEVTLIGLGTAHIIANVLANGEYCDATPKQYTLNVTCASPFGFATTAVTQPLSAATYSRAATSILTTAEITYASSNQLVATVDETGLVTFITDGTTIISASCEAAGNYCSKISSNAYTLTITAPAPANDLCDNAIELPCGTISGTLAGATSSGSTYTSPAKPDVFYYFTAPKTGSYTVTLTGFAGDKDLHLYQDCDDKSADYSSTNLGINPESITFTGVAGISYTLRFVDYTSNANSTFNLTLTCPLTVTVTSNNEDLGLVGYNSTTKIISVLPENCYEYTYEITPEGAAIVTPTANEDEFIVSSITNDCEIAFTFAPISPKTVTLYNYGEEIEQLTYTCTPLDLTDYAPSPCNSEWTFAGWDTTAVSSETTSAPTLIANPTTYIPTSNIMLYAVYKKVEDGGNGAYTMTYGGNTANWTISNTTCAATTGNGGYVLVQNNYILSPEFDLSSITSISINGRRYGADQPIRVQNEAGTNTLGNTANFENSYSNNAVTISTPLSGIGKLKFIAPSSSSATCSATPTNSNGVAIHSITINYNPTTYSSTPNCISTCPEAIICDATYNEVYFPLTQTGLNSLLPLEVYAEDVEADMTFSFESGAASKFSVSPVGDWNPREGGILNITFSPTAEGYFDDVLRIEGSCDTLLVYLYGEATSLHTVTFNPGNGTCAKPSMTQDSIEHELELPVAVPNTNCADRNWIFAGWSTVEVASGTTIAPPLVNSAAYFPETDHTLYAVYKRNTLPNIYGTSPNCVVPEITVSNNIRDFGYILPSTSSATLTFTVSAIDITAKDLEVVYSGGAEFEVIYPADWNNRNNATSYTGQFSIKFNAPATEQEIVRTLTFSSASTGLSVVVTLIGHSATLHTVTLVTATGIIDFDDTPRSLTWTQSYLGEGLILPEIAASFECGAENWEFNGWTEDNTVGNNPLNPVTSQPAGVYPFGYNYIPTSDVTLHTLYLQKSLNFAWGAFEPDVNTPHNFFITAVPDDNLYYALKQDPTFDAANRSVGVDITDRVLDGSISNEDAVGMVWTISSPINDGVHFTIFDGTNYIGKNHTESSRDLEMSPTYISADNRFLWDIRKLTQLDIDSLPDAHAQSHITEYQYRIASVLFPKRGLLFRDIDVTATPDKIWNCFGGYAFSNIKKGTAYNDQFFYITLIPVSGGEQESYMNAPCTPDPVILANRHIVDMGEVWVRDGQIPNKDTISVAAADVTFATTAFSWKYNNQGFSAQKLANWSNVYGGKVEITFNPTTVGYFADTLYFFNTEDNIFDTVLVFGRGVECVKYVEVKDTVDLISNEDYKYIFVGIDGNNYYGLGKQLYNAQGKTTYRASYPIKYKDADTLGIVVAEIDPNQNANYTFELREGATARTWQFFSITDNGYLRDSTSNRLFTRNATPYSEYSITGLGSNAVNVTSVAGYQSGYQIRFNPSDLTFKNYVTSNSTTLKPRIYRNLLPYLAAPAFDLPEGTYDEVQTLTLTAEAGATIFYTLDGTEPYRGGFSISSPAPAQGGPQKVTQIYSVNIPIPIGTTTVKAMAWKLGKEQSKTITLQYVVMLPISTGLDDCKPQYPSPTLTGQTNPFVMDNHTYSNQRVWSTPWACADDEITIEQNTFWNIGANWDCLKDYTGNQMKTTVQISTQSGSLTGAICDQTVMTKAYTGTSPANWAIYYTKFRLSDFYGPGASGISQMKVNIWNEWSGNQTCGDMYIAIHQYTVDLTVPRLIFFSNENIPITFHNKIDNSNNAGNLCTALLKSAEFSNDVNITNQTKTGNGVYTYNITAGTLSVGTHRIYAVANSLGGAIRTDSIDIQIVQKPTVALSADASITEGDDFTVTATLSNTVPYNITVNLAFHSTSQLTYLTGTKAITITAGQSSGSTTLGTTNTVFPEETRTVKLTNGIISDGVTGDVTSYTVSPNITTTTIIDDPDDICNFEYPNPTYVSNLIRPDTLRDLDQYRYANIKTYVSAYANVHDSITIEFNTFWKNEYSIGRNPLGDYTSENGDLRLHVWAKIGGVDKAILNFQSMPMVFKNTTLDYAIYARKFTMADNGVLNQNDLDTVSKFYFLIDNPTGNHDEYGWTGDQNRFLHTWNVELTASQLVYDNPANVDGIVLTNKLNEYESQSTFAASNKNICSATYQWDDGGVESATSGIIAGNGAYTLPTVALSPGIHRLVATITSHGGGTNSDTLYISVNPVITLSITPNVINETGAITSATVTASMPMSTPAGDITVPLVITGGIDGTDYSISSTTITIPANSTSGTATITAVDNGICTDIVLSITNGTITSTIPGVTTLSAVGVPLSLTIKNTNVGLDFTIGNLGVQCTSTSEIIITVNDLYPFADNKFDIRFDDEGETLQTSPYTHTPLDAGLHTISVSNAAGCMTKKHIRVIK